MFVESIRHGDRCNVHNWVSSYDTSYHVRSRRKYGETNLKISRSNHAVSRLADVQFETIALINYCPVIDNNRLQLRLRVAISAQDYLKQ